MKRIFGTWMSLFAVLAGMFLLTGCGEKTCHFLVPEAEGLEAGAPVEWHNATIGTVKNVQTTEDGVRVDIVFDAAHVESVHDGVTAWVMDNPSRWPKPFVELLGGLDENRPILTSGVRIPSARSDNVVQEKFMRFDDWLSGKSERYVAGLVALLGLLKIFGKRIGAFFRKLFWLAFWAGVVYVAWSIHSDWDSHRARFENIKSKAQGAIEQLGQQGEKISIVTTLVEEGED